jgi:hypothetical protein
MARRIEEHSPSRFRLRLCGLRAQRKGASLQLVDQSKCTMDVPGQTGGW